MWYNKGERRGKYGKIHSENGGKEGEKSPMHGDGAGDGRAEGKGGETEKMAADPFVGCGSIWSGTAGHPAGDNGLQLCKAQEEVGRKA